MKRLLGCVAAALVVGVIGCDRDSDTTAPPTPQEKSVQSQVQDATKGVVGDLQTKSQEMQQQADQTKAAAESAAQEKVAEAKTAANDASSEAQKLLDQALQYAKENKFDLAEQTLAKAEALPNLPDSVKAKIPEVRKTIQAMKSSGDASKAAQDAGKAAQDLIK